MTVVVLKYTLMIADSIRKARQQRAITQCEAEYLGAMSEDSYPAASTRELIGAQPQAAMRKHVRVINLHSFCCRGSHLNMTRIGQRLYSATFTKRTKN